MCDHYFVIGKRIIDEAMRLIRSSLPLSKDIRICSCTMREGLQKLIKNTHNNSRLGMFRLVFSVDGKPKVVLVNADYVIKKHCLQNV